MLLDFDPGVTSIASQPFWLRWHDQAGARVSHAPDFFARRADGSAVVVDCRPSERRGPRDMAKFEATRQACARVGWEYQLVGATDEIVTANVRWLAGYRHPRHDQLGPAGLTMIIIHDARDWFEFALGFEWQLSGPGLSATREGCQVRIQAAIRLTTFG
jgi:hypothetical protein